MTGYDERPSGGDGPTGRTERTGQRYVAYETDDGTLVIRDEREGDAWIQSDTVVDLASDDD